MPRMTTSLEDSARRLLAKGLIAPAPPKTSNPAAEALIFFHEIPTPLLEVRYRVLQAGLQVSDWYLFTATDDPSWLDVMQGEFGVSVAVLDDAGAVEATRGGLLA
jgi:hypothetical protein